MFRLVHTADWHWEADKIDKCHASADFIIKKLRELKPDLHVIAGDYWNRRQMLTKLSAVIPALETMRQLADISPVVLIYGNEAHDAAGSYEIFRNLDTRFPIYVSERAETISFHVPSHSFDSTDSIDEATAILHLFPYPTKQWFLAGKENLSIDESNQLIQDALRNIFIGFGAISMEAPCPVIFVGHCNVSGAVLSSGQSLLGQDIMVGKRDLDLVRAHYYALGHIHKPQRIAPGVHYSGSIYHCNFGEVEKKSFNLVEFDQAQVPKVLPIEIPSRPLSLHDLNWDEESGPQPMFWDPNDVVDWEGAELRVRVNATKEKHALITDAEIESRYRLAHSITVDRIISPQERIRSSEIVKAKTLPEKVFEWGSSIQKEIPANVLTLAGDIERSITL